MEMGNFCFFFVFLGEGCEDGEDVEDDVTRSRSDEEMGDDECLQTEERRHRPYP